MTERFAADIVRAYATKTGVPRSRFALTHGTVCDVRFAARRIAGHAAVGRYRIVVVNPQKHGTRPSAAAEPAARAAAKLAAYAKSDDAQAIALHDGFVAHQDI